MSELVFVHRVDSNVGDFLSGPYRYWEWPTHEVIDILDNDRVSRLLPGARVVIGGGGLLMPFFSNYLLGILARRPTKVVWWGIGDRWIQNLAGFLSASDAQHRLDEYCFPSGHLVGVRVMNSIYPYLPCSSCKFIDAHIQTHGLTDGSGLAIFEHEAVGISASPDIPRLVNDRCTPEEAVAFIASCRCLITNSYHGMYWGRLLDKPVICVPFSCSAYHQEWGVLIASPEDVRDRLDQKVREAAEVATRFSREPRALLRQSLALNDAFYKDARAYLGSRDSDRA